MDRPFYESRYKDTSKLEADVQTVEIVAPVCEVCGASSCYACDKCQTVIHPGMWWSCHGNPDEHGGNIKHYGFEPYVDEHISANGKDIGFNLSGEKVQGTFINSRDERRTMMKRLGLESGGFGTNKHRKSSNRGNNVDATAERIVREASQEWNKRR